MRLIRIRRLAALLGVVVPLCGCGSDDSPSSPPADNPTDGGLDGAAGQAGQAGVGGQGAFGGSGGAAGTGGTAGDGGSAGTAGTGGAAGAGGAAGMGGAAGTGGAAGMGGAAGTGGAAGMGGSPGCATAADCPQTSEVCDPVTLECAASVCDPADYTSCPSYPDTICLDQSNDEGACYAACTPWDSAVCCSLGADCLVQSDDESLGLCFHPGTAGVGEPCVPTDTGTGCSSGSVCVNLGTPQDPERQCAKSCQVFSDAPTGCSPTELCMVGSLCLSASIGFYDEVAVGELCTLDDYYFCGEEDGRLVGTCDDAPSGGAELRCYRWCRLALGEMNNADCDAADACTDTDWGNGLGVCVPGG